MLLPGGSDSEGEFEGFEPMESYVTPNFDGWGKNKNPRNIHKFTERTGQTRVLDSSTEAIEFFPL